MNSININGSSFSGNSIKINNGKIFIDGVDKTPDAKDINITVTGNIDSLSCDNANKIDVTGDAGSIKTMSGDVFCGGNVSGNVQTMSGDVQALIIEGDVSTMSGDIKHKRI